MNALVFHRVVVLVSAVAATRWRCKAMEEDVLVVNLLLSHGKQLVVLYLIIPYYYFCTVLRCCCSFIYLCLYSFFSVACTCHD